jgi:hypothetical protein
MGSVRSDARFSHVVLVVAPYVTIRNCIGELDPRRTNVALRKLHINPPSVYPPHTRSCVFPTHAYARRGRVLIKN